MEGSSSGQAMPSGTAVQPAWRNKRRSLRLDVTLPVQWIRRSGNLDLRASDINLYGFFIVTDQRTEPGRLQPSGSEALSVIPINLPISRCRRR